MRNHCRHSFTDAWFLGFLIVVPPDLLADELCVRSGFEFRNDCDFDPLATDGRGR